MPDESRNVGTLHLVRGDALSGEALSRLCKSVTGKELTDEEKRQFNERFAAAKQKAADSGTQTAPDATP